MGVVGTWDMGVLVFGKIGSVRYDGPSLAEWPGRSGTFAPGSRVAEWPSRQGCTCSITIILYQRLVSTFHFLLSSLHG